MTPDTTDTQTLADVVRAGLKARQRGTGSTRNTKPALDALDRLVAAVAALQHERDERMTDYDYNAATQKFVDRVCHYRNLAITLGAKPEDMLSHFDRELAEKGIGDGYENDAPELWEELEVAEERVRVLEARQAPLEAVAEAARERPCNRFDVTPCNWRPEIDPADWCAMCKAIEAMDVLDADTPEEAA